MQALHRQYTGSVQLQLTRAKWQALAGEGAVQAVQAGSTHAVCSSGWAQYDETARAKSRALAGERQYTQVVHGWYTVQA